MKVIEDYPPNYKKITKQFSLEGLTPVFAYGDTIYNPHKMRLYPDMIIHEEVHKRQQGNQVDEWWGCYLTDKKFRLDQELEAYGAQFSYLKKILSAKKQQMALTFFGSCLAGPTYGNLLTSSEAESKIRNRAKIML